MDRRREVAWLGSIAVTGCASVLVLGSFVGWFGLGPSPAQDTQVASFPPIPGGTEPRPVPGNGPPIGTGSRVLTGGARFPANVPIWPFGVTASVSAAPTSPGGFAIPSPQTGATTARSSRTREAPLAGVVAGNRPAPVSETSLRWEAYPAAPKVDITQPAGGVHGRGLGPRRITETASKIAGFGLSVARGNGSVSGRSSGGGKNYRGRAPRHGSAGGRRG